MSDEKINELKNIVAKEKKLVEEIIYFLKQSEKVQDPREKKMISSQIRNLKFNFKKDKEDISKVLDEINLKRSLNYKKLETSKEKEDKSIEIHQDPSTKKDIKVKKSEVLEDASELERDLVKRLKKKEKKIIYISEKKPSKFIQVSNKFFGKFANDLSKKDIFEQLERDLVQANLQFIPMNYISMSLMIGVLSVIISLFLFLFFMFFNISPQFPIISVSQEDIFIRLLKIFWIPIAIPIITLIFMYIYPSLEKKSIENKINQELPFATIHMAALSGSMINPGNIFRIIIFTKEYPTLEREFTKLINEINLYGYNLVNGLRNVAFNNPSKKVSELFNGLATTISSGGDMRQFFEKRAENLLFEHRLEREKYTKFAETFMDIYISVVIAAPMILMLLLMMMKISGLGINLSISMITLIMVLAVSGINVMFLTFLHLKQPTE